MTPKEKALELIQKYNLVVLDTALGGSNQRVKQCALIAVDELIRVTPWGGDIDNEIEDGSKEFYMKVKQEIEKL
jgi:hypothetical protein